MAAINSPTLGPDKASIKRKGTSHRSPNSRAKSVHEPYPEELPEDSTSTQAPGSEAENRSKSRTSPSSHTTHSPTSPDRRRPKKGRAATLSLTQHSSVVPPRGSHSSGSTQGQPGGYHTAKVHWPKVDPPVAPWLRQTKQEVHLQGGAGGTTAAGPTTVATLSFVPLQKNR